VAASALETTPSEMTKAETEYAARAKSWGLSDVDFQRLCHAWSVARRGTDERLAEVVGEKYAPLGRSVMTKISERGLRLSPAQAVEVDQLYRECCAELMLGIKDADAEKKIVDLWLKVMKV
jgi:hypothetical protein